MQQTIEHLVTCLPVPEHYEGGLRALLVGRHQFARTTAKGTTPMDVEIQKLTVVPEGWGATQYCLKEGIIKPTAGTYAAFFDLGRGTAIFWLVDLETMLTVEGSRGVLRKSGLQKLLTLIQQEPAFQERVGSQGDASISLLHDAIVGNTFLYGTTGHSFRDVYDHYAFSWMDSIYKEAISKWSVNPTWADSVGQVVVVGGAAPVAGSWINEKSLAEFVSIPPQAQFANCLGMLAGSGSVLSVDPGNGWGKWSNGTQSAKFKSVISDRFSAPKENEFTPDSVYLVSDGGPLGKFKKFVGSGAGKGLHSAATVNEDKGAIAQFLILAAIQPTPIAARKG